MNKYDRSALLDKLHSMNDEVGQLTGDKPYMYANRPNTDNGTGAEHFHFQGDTKITGLEAAVTHMGGLLERARREHSA